MARQQTAKETDGSLTDSQNMMARQRKSNTLMARQHIAKQTDGSVTDSQTN